MKEIFIFKKGGALTCFRNINLKWNVIKFVMIIGLMHFGSHAFAQQRKITGIVNDGINGEPLIGVSIINESTKKGTITDASGNFTIDGISTGQVLSISYVGFVTEKVTINDQTNYEIKLLPDLKSLEEIVVIGYGTVKKGDATGSVASVSLKDFNKGSITSPENLLMGRSAGVVITSNSGGPGVGSTIRIRGGSSMSASNDPLIVVDGTPLDQNISGTANTLNSINPNDIDNFSILKDASATAIYGSRASNGVIIINTKKGTKKFSVNYSVNTSIHKVVKYVDVLSGDEFYRKVVENFPFKDTAQAHLAKSYLGNANTNWQKEIYRTSVGQDHNLSVGGIVKNVPMRLSVGYTNDNGVLKSTYYERTTAALSVNPSLLGDHLKFNINVKVNNENNNFGDQSAITDAVMYNPTVPVRDPLATRWREYTTWTDDTKYKYGNNPNAKLGRNLVNPGTANPVAKLDLTDNSSNLLRSIGNIQTDYQFHILPDLHAVLNLAYDYSKTKGHNNVKDSAQWLYTPVSGAGRIENYTESRKNELLTFNLNYSKDLQSIHSKISALAGYEWNHFWKENVDSAYDATMTTVVKGLSKPKTEYYIVSFFGRVNYSLMDKYLMTFTLRDDGTSRFSSNNRWGLFPSVAFAWKVKDESFLQNSNLFSDLKVRLGYGVTGQQQVSDNNYPYIPTFQTSQPQGSYALGYGNFIQMLRPKGYDASLKWESTATYNLGLDFGFLKNRLTGAIDFYSRKTTDLINSINVPAGTNLSQPLLTNVGSLTNQGIELSLDAKIVSTKDFLWQIGYNISYNKNKITKLNYADNPNYYVLTGSTVQGSSGDLIQAQKVGNPVNSFLVRKQVYDKNGKPLEGVYDDLNHDGQINTGDLYIYKQPAATVLMGVSTTVNYKNVDFSANGRISLDNYVYNNTAEMTTYNSFIGALSNRYIANITPSAAVNNFTTGQTFSDYWIENASFFKMDNISLGYTFSKLIKGKGSLHINASVQNVFVVTKYTGLDPEVNGGIDNNFYPRPRTYMVGLNFNF